MDGASVFKPPVSLMSVGGSKGEATRFRHRFPPSYTARQCEQEVRKLPLFVGWREDQEEDCPQSHTVALGNDASSAEIIHFCHPFFGKLDLYT